MIRGALLVAALAVTGCATTLETVYVPAENSGWKIGHGTNRANATLLEFIPSEETISSWSRMFTIQFLEGARDAPRDFARVLQAQATSRCSNTRWNVLSEDASSITYQWSISDCPGHVDETEIARLLKGNDGLHRIAYVRKGPTLEASEQAKWLEAFSKAYVEKGGRRVVVAP
jgi:hypothetical protein